MAKGAALAALFAVVGLSSGCFWAPNLAGVRKDIERQLPGATFDKEIELSLGPVSLAFARLITGLIPDAREARPYLNNVSRIEVAVYTVDGMPSAEQVTTPAELRKLQESGEWEMAVKVHDGDDRVWVMYRIAKDSIEDIYVVVLSDDELVLVKAHGNLERVAAYAISESGGFPRRGG
jgi:hypothetical protein